MTKQTVRSDLAPWQKVRTLEKLKPLLRSGETLSTNLRMTKYSPVGGRVKKQAVDWMCKGIQTPRHCPLPPKATIFEMQLKSRLLINHSGGVMENAGLAIHRHFGTPYIPGSAVKGIARHMAWLDWRETEDSDDKKLYAECIAEIFGYPTGEKKLDDSLKSEGIETRSGAIAFFSAQVYKKTKLDTDLINSHERGNPTPVFFPAVASGTIFEFAISPLQIKTENDIDTLMYLAGDWLKRGLKEQGAGAKTNAGYGWFEEVE